MKINIKEIRTLTVALAVLALFVSTISAQPIATDFGVNDVSGSTNTFISVPVSITNVQKESIAGIALDISFDSSIINLTEVQKGDLTSAWDSPSLNLTDGRISIVFGGRGTEIPVGKSGSVAILNFSVIGAPGAKSPINISGIQLSGLEGTVGTASAKDGILTVVGNISGTTLTVKSTDVKKTVNISRLPIGTTVQFVLNNGVPVIIKAEDDGTAKSRRGRDTISLQV